MRKFIYKTFLFLLPVLIAGVVLEILLRTMPNDYKAKRTFMEQNGSGLEMLIMGSSHAYYSINPVYFDKKAYNAAYVSQSLDYDLAILEKYAVNLPSLEYIILPLSSFSLFSRLETGDESWRAVNYSLYYDLSSGFSISNNFEVFSNRLNVSLNRIYSFYVLNESNLTADSAGWGKFEVHQAQINMTESGKDAATRHSVDPGLLSNQEILHENLQILSAFLQICERRDINVLLITPPAYKTYVQHLNATQLDLLITSAHRLTARHDNSIYINFLQDHYFDIDDFEDADHLSEKGARKFSMLLDEIVLKEWETK